MKLLVLFVLLVATLYHSLPADAAAVKVNKVGSEAFGDMIRKQFLGVGSNNIVRIARDTEEMDDEEKRICYNAPCGWAVYHPITREIEYFMTNTCECPDSSYKCVRIREDLSASAFVYRCRQNTTDSDTILEVR